MSKLLIPEHPILILPTLAQKIGLYEAIFLQQLHYWLTKSEHIHEGRRWVYNSMESWHEQLPFISVSTIRRVVKKLEEENILLTGNFNPSKLDRTKWYTIDYEALDALLDEDKSSDQPEQIIRSQRSHDSSNVNTPIPENTTETTTEKKKEEEEDNARVNEQQNPYTFFEENGFGTISGYIAEKINYWCEDLSDELVVEAMKLAVEYGAKNWAYVESVLRYWYDKGYETVRDVHASRKAFKERMMQKMRVYQPNPPNDTEYDINAGEEDDT